MSPHPYEVIHKPGNVTVCYGCGGKFDENSNEFVIKHIDRRIKGKGPNGEPLYNYDFTAAYYHTNVSHIKRKNPVFNGCVDMKSCLYQEIGREALKTFASAAGLVVNIIPYIL